MPEPNPWLEPRTLIDIFSLVIGVSGFLFGVWSYLWKRKESRLNALSIVLQPMVQMAQQLLRANDLRRTCEQLKNSFPNPTLAPEAVEHIKKMGAEYGKHLSNSEDEFRKAESEFASRSFRFPDRIARLIKTAQGTLSEYGRLVNEGKFDRADLQLAKFRDDYKQITSVGRGWRLTDPFEGIFKRFRGKKDQSEHENKFDLTEKEMNAILDLVYHRATTQAQNTFAVHPPKKLLDNPKIVQSDNVVEELSDSIFVVVFQDGTTKMLSFVELMVFTYNLIVLAHKQAEVGKMMAAVRPTDSQKVQVSFQFSLSDIMRPELVKTLLSKIDFAKLPSDG